MRLSDLEALPALAASVAKEKIYSCFQNRQQFSKRTLFSGFALASMSFGAVLPLSAAAPDETGLFDESELTVSKGEALPADRAASRQQEICALRKELKEKKVVPVDPAAVRLALPEECLSPEAIEIPAAPAATDSESEALEDRIRDIVSGYPIEVMAPAISQYDPKIAGLIVGIAKKESGWGEHVPTKNGADCFNYWGYKGAGSRGSAMGYGCFGSPEEAVSAIGDRLSELAEKRQSAEPRHLVVWKCGSSCAGHNPEGVRKWISDVNLYYQKIALF